jgi:spore coat protein U-like protein
MRHSRRLFAFAAGLVLATSLHAASTPAPLNVSAEVAPNCVIAISNLAFGKYDPLGQNANQQLDAAAEVTMLCTRSSRAALYIDSGRNPMGSSRTLSGTSQHIAYQLFRDADRTRQWAAGEGDGLQFVSEGIHKPQQLTVYGRIPPGQEVASGVYTDVVTATVDF